VIVLCVGRLRHRRHRDHGPRGRRWAGTPPSWS